jgi:hypothetical protein
MFSHAAKHSRMLQRFLTLALTGLVFVIGFQADDADALEPLWKSGDLFSGAIIGNRGEAQFHDITPRGFLVGGIKEIRHFYPQQGVWIGARNNITMFDNALGLVWEGWLLVPNQTNVTSRYYNDMGNVQAQREWSADVEDYYLDASICFSWFSNWRKNGWSQINGFRWERFEQTFKNPGSSWGNLISAWESPDDRVDMRSDYFIPYIGIQMERRRSGLCGLGKMLVSPLVLGSLFHREVYAGASLRKDEGLLYFDPGYFFEFMMELEYRTTPDLRLGCFIKMSALNLYGEGVIDTTGQVAGKTSGTYDLVHRKLSYMAGLKVNYTFNFSLWNLLP